eukprot:TRINITY_DN45018_c0_g1_i1.p1 TRINITY_DN45018_c0_g1~~TRINITY_DN45018_c0_g1_i1.p1  ORF type:complete len:909 (-),score=345.57 TRINITY_DN45018_c0_g1_i1:223-2949(-)
MGHGECPATLTVKGCKDATVQKIVKGTFNMLSGKSGKNHGKPVYKRDTPANGVDVMLYYWDDRDGDHLWGWYLGPQVGGEQVWAFCPSKTSRIPPPSGWRVPFDGPVDKTLVVSADSEELDGSKRKKRKRVASEEAPTVEAKKTGGEKRRRGEEVKVSKAASKSSRAATKRKKEETSKRERRRDTKKKVRRRAAVESSDDDEDDEEDEESSVSCKPVKKAEKHEPRRKEKKAKKEAAEEVDDSEESEDAQTKARKQQMKSMQKFQEYQQKQWQQFQQMQSMAHYQHMQAVQTQQASIEADRKRREEEHRAKIEQMRKEQEDAKKRMEDQRRKQEEENRAAMAMIRLTQQVRVATPENYEGLKKELQETWGKEESKLGAQHLRMQAEMEKCIAHAEMTVMHVINQRKLIEEKHHKALSLLLELRRLADDSEARLDALQACTVKLEPKVNGKVEDVESMAERSDVVSKAVADADATAAECKAFIAHRGPEVHVTGPTPDVNPQELREYLMKIMHSSERVAAAANALRRQSHELRDKVRRRRTAIVQQQEKEELFQQFDRDGDGHLSRQEALDLARSAWHYPSLSEKQLDHVWWRFAHQDDAGITIGQLHGLKAAVGVLRELQRDRERKEDRLERAKAFATTCVQLKEGLQAVKRTVDAADDEVCSLETRIAALQRQAKKLEPVEMAELADGIVSGIEGATEVTSKAWTQLGGLHDGHDPNLKEEVESFLLKEGKRLNLRLGRMDHRITRIKTLTTRFCTMAVKRLEAEAGDELEAEEAEAEKQPEEKAEPTIGGDGEGAPAAAADASVDVVADEDAADASPGGAEERDDFEMPPSPDFDSPEVQAVLLELMQAPDYEEELWPPPLPVPAPVGPIGMQAKAPPAAISKSASFAAAALLGAKALSKASAMQW